MKITEAKVSLVIERELARISTPILEEFGFKKRQMGFLTVDLSEGVIGILTLAYANKYTVKGVIDLGPHVGVRHQHVEKIVAECRGEKFHSYIPPTASEMLGYVMPEKSFLSATWTLDLNDVEGSERVLREDVACVVTTYGVPYMQSLVPLPALCRRLEGRGLHQHMKDYRRPVAYYLAGDIARAREILDESAARLRDRDDGAAQELRSFISAFGEYMNKD